MTFDSMILIPVTRATLYDPEDGDGRRPMAVFMLSTWITSLSTIRSTWGR